LNSLIQDHGMSAFEALTFAVEWFNAGRIDPESASETITVGRIVYTDANSPEPNPILHAEYMEDYDAVNVQSLTYAQWLQERYEGLAGALRDDPPRDREELATDYRALAALLTELERIDPS
jgi:hypothetical protein